MKKTLCNPSVSVRTECIFYRSGIRRKMLRCPLIAYIKEAIKKSGGIVKTVIHGIQKSGFVQMVRCVLIVPGGCSGLKAMICSP